MQAALVLFILGIAILLFATGWLRMDLVSLLILLSLPLCGLLTTGQTFAAFSNPAVITVAAMFVLSAAIANTGVTAHLGRWILSFAEQSETRLVFAIMLLAAISSAFINNIGAAAVLLPMVTGIAKRTNIPPSRLLMPLAFNSLAGGVCTVVEVALTSTNELVGRTLRELHFRDTHGLNVLAIWRRGEPVIKSIDHVVLKFGDMLLIEGTENKILHLADKHDFLLLGGIKSEPYLPAKGPVALLIMLGVIFLTTSGIFPIMLVATLGAVLMVLTRCISLTSAYESINWPVIILLAGTLPLGLAMEVSGVSALLATQLTALAGPYGPWLTLSVLFLITMLLTCVMSNAATAVLLAPIAFDLSLQFGVHPQPFFMAVALAASTCFMTPVSHQSNALVVGPGGYHFVDYLKVGTPLNLLIWIFASLTIPLVFPF